MSISESFVTASVFMALASIRVFRIHTIVVQSTSIPSDRGHHYPSGLTLTFHDEVNYGRRPRHCPHRHAARRPGAREDTQEPDRRHAAASWRIGLHRQHFRAISERTSRQA